MKILVVGPSPKKSKGGMATVIADISESKELSNRYEIDIFDSYIDGNIVIRLIFSIIAFVKFCITKRHYDIYHIHVASRGSTFRKGYYVWAAKKWKKKVILHIHGAQYKEFYNETSDEKKKKIIGILKSADLVIALSSYWKEYFEQTFGLENCVILENGINMERLDCAISSPEMFQKSFVALGRLGKRKGTYDLVEAVEIAAKTVPEIRVYIAGDGDVKEVRQLVEHKNLNNNIEVVGWADFDKKLDLLKHVSTVVLPSYNEGLPMSILEGMACRKAIISTTVGAIPEVIKEKNGILINPGDIIGLSDALVRCSTNANLIMEIGSMNYIKIQNEFSLNVMHQKLARYYETLYEE